MAYYENYPDTQEEQQKGGSTDTSPDSTKEAGEERTGEGCELSQAEKEIAAMQALQSTDYLYSNQAVS